MRPGRKALSHLVEDSIQVGIYLQLYCRCRLANGVSKLIGGKFECVVKGEYARDRTLRTALRCCEDHAASVAIVSREVCPAAIS